MNPTQFLCPECGSHQSSEVYLVETDPRETDPWSAILERLLCAHCGYVIPAHLAELWNGLSPEAARLEWRQRFRGGAPSDRE